MTALKHQRAFSRDAALHEALSDFALQLNTAGQEADASVVEDIIDRFWPLAQSVNLTVCTPGCPRVCSGHPHHVSEDPAEGISREQSA